MNITVTGPQALPADAAERCENLRFERFMAPFVEAGHTFFVGGAAGVGTLALQWLVTRRAPVTIVVPATVQDQPDEAAEPIRKALQASLVDVVELEDPRFPEPEASQAMNQYMVDRSDLVIGFQLGDSRDGDTWYTMEYAASSQTPRLIVPV